jgi:orotate phosphoribosyltransferase
MAPDYEKARLKELIIHKALVVRREQITLSSGQKTNHYYDLKRVLAHSEGLKLVGILMLEEMLKMGPVKSVGGLETGAISISVAISRESLEHEHDNISWFFVRKKPKGHGLQNMIEGNVLEPVVVVEDVVTKGESVLKAIEVLQSKWKHMLGVVAIIDRGGGKDNLQAKHKIKFSSLFEDKDFEDVVKERLTKLNV